MNNGTTQVSDSGRCGPRRWLDTLARCGIAAALTASCTLTGVQNAQATELTVTGTGSTADTLWEQFAETNDIILEDSLSIENCRIYAGDTWSTSTALKDTGTKYSYGGAATSTKKVSLDSTTSLCYSYSVYTPSWDQSTKTAYCPKIWLQASSDSSLAKGTYTYGSTNTLVTVEYPDIAMARGNYTQTFGIRVAINRVYLAKWYSNHTASPTSGYMSFFGWTDEDVDDNGDPAPDGTFESMSVMSESIMDASEISYTRQKSIYNCSSYTYNSQTYPVYGDIAVAYTIELYDTDSGDTVSAKTALSSSSSSASVDFPVVVRDLDMPGYTYSTSSSTNAITKTWDTEDTLYAESVQFNDGWDKAAYSINNIITAASDYTLAKNTGKYLWHTKSSGSSRFQGLGTFSDDPSSGDTGIDNHEDELRSAVMATISATGNSAVSGSARWCGIACRTQIGFGSENTPAMLQIIKKDTSTGEAMADTSFMLEYSSSSSFPSSSTVTIGTFTTDSQGKINLSGLSYGWYRLTETSAPNGYAKSSDKLIFQLTAAQTAATSTSLGSGNNVASCEYYSAEVIGGKVCITAYDSPAINLDYTHSWVDNDDALGLRPATLSVTLLKDGSTDSTKSVSSSDNWKCAWNTYPAYHADGTKINYTIKEFSVDDYETEITQFAADSSGNLHASGVSTLPLIDINVEKVWTNDGGWEYLRPDSVTVSLYANGTDTGRDLTLSDADEWKGTYTGLQKTSGNVAITYTVVEDEVPEHYNCTVSGNAEDGFTVTNKRTTTPVLEFPSTGSTALLGIIIALVAAIAGGISVIVVRRRRRAGTVRTADTVD